MNYLLRFMLCTLALATGLYARADDAYNSYVADVLLHESHQARSPESVIRYTDGPNGALLKSVLNPDRAKPMLAAYVARARRGSGDLDLPKLIAPMLNRYEKAFDTQGSAYENEYLDAVQMSSLINATAMSMMDTSATNGATEKREGRQLTADETKMVASLNALLKSMELILKAANQHQADAIRKKVTEGKFSQEGSRRALRLAQAIAAPLPSQQLAAAQPAGPATSAAAPTDECAVSVVQDGKAVPLQMAGGAPSYVLRGAPFRIEVASAACEPSIGILLNAKDFSFVAGSTVVATVAGFTNAGIPRDDVLFFRSEDPHLLPPFENMFDGLAEPYAAWCDRLSKCPLQIRAFRNRGPFISDAQGTPRSFAEFNRLSADKLLLGARGDVYVVVYTNLKATKRDQRDGFLEVFAVHPFILRFY